MLVLCLIMRSKQLARDDVTKMTLWQEESEKVEDVRCRRCMVGGGVLCPALRVGIEQ